MAKFKVFKYNQAYLARLGVYSDAITEPTNEFFKSIAAYYILIVGMCTITSSAVYVYANTDKFGDTLDPCSIVISGITCACMYLNIGLKMIKAKALHIKLQDIVDEGMD